jgi:hypothetical protein
VEAFDEVLSSRGDYCDCIGAWNATCQVMDLFVGFKRRISSLLAFFCKKIIKYVMYDAMMGRCYDA